MNRYLLVFCIMLLTLSAKSQAVWTNNIGATWYFSYFDWTISGTIKRVYTGDTIINGKQLKTLSDQLYRAKYVFPNGIPTQVLDTIVPFGRYFLQISGDSIIHYLPAYDTVPERSYLLYNFGAEIGDEWDILPYGAEICPYSKLKVTDKGVDTLSGIPVRWIFVQPVDSSAYGILGKINEYFGPTNSTMFPWYLSDCTGDIIETGSCYIRCFSDGVVEYHGNQLNAVCNPLSGISELLPASTQFTIYPNPSQGITNINPSNTTYSYNLTVYDMAGRQLQSANGLKGNYQLETEALPKGIYTLRIEQTGKLYYHKLQVN